MSLFTKPNLDRDRELLEVEKERQSRGQDFTSRFWKAIAKEDLRNDDTITEEVGIRILPATQEDAEYNITTARHFLRYGPTDFEQYTCMKIVYGEKCAGCEEYERRLEIAKAESGKEARKQLMEKANFYRPQRRGIFNVLGVKYTTYHKEGKTERVIDDTVKLFQSPISLWTKIISIVSSRGRSSDIFDDFDENGKITKPGRDIIVIYDKNQLPMNQYNAVPTDYVELGTQEQLEQWVEQITPLNPNNQENVSYRVDEEVAHIKTFGSRKEREEMREMLKEHWAEQRKLEKDKQEAEEVKDGKEDLDTKPPKQEKNKAKPKVETPAEPVTTTVPETATKEPEPEKEKAPEPQAKKVKETDEKLTGLKAKLAKIKNKAD